MLEVMGPLRRIAAIQQEWGDSRDGWVRNGPRPALPSVHININKKKRGSFDRWSLVIELK